MPRCVPECPQIPEKRADGRFETKTYSIQLITPMFGGGVEAGSPDASFPIRGTAIRGQLEFWWRATRGAVYADKDALFGRHAAVWGKTECASPVEIEALDVVTEPPVRCARWDQTNHGYSLRWNPPFDGFDKVLTYALFPFQGDSPNRANAKDPATYIPRGSFVLRVRFPESLRQDVETAVWAWVNFGGLGARTRRGCGALLCEELAPPNLKALATWFRNDIEPCSDVRDWPLLSRTFRVLNQSMQPIEAWANVIGLLKFFRQGEDFARNPGHQPGRPGRSRWPESDTIRRAMNTWPAQHQPRQFIPNAFPRAELGLPIVFQYKGHGEPDNTVLEPKGPERMASPLILKPLVFVDGQAVPLVVRLVTPKLAGVDLKHGSVSKALPPQTAIRGTHLATFPNSPLAGAPSTGSALDAFCAFADDDGFAEVQL